MRTSPVALLAAAPLVLAATSPAAAAPTLTTKQVRGQIANTATYEELYRILHGRFTTGTNGLRRAGWRPAKGFAVLITLKGKGARASYCIEGWSGAGRHYRLVSTKPGKVVLGTCLPAAPVSPTASGTASGTAPAS